MTIYNAADYGYANSGDDPVICRKVDIGDVFRLDCALGVYECRVLRPHRDAGYFETVFVRWVTEVPAFRRGFVGSIEVMSRENIIAAKYGD